MITSAKPGLKPIKIIVIAGGARYLRPQDVVPAGSKQTIASIGGFSHKPLQHVRKITPAHEAIDIEMRPTTARAWATGFTVTSSGGRTLQSQSSGDL